MSESGVKQKGHDAGQLPRKMTEQYFDHYDGPEFTVANAQTNYDVSSNEANAFSTVKKVHSCIIRTDQNITVRFNSTSNDAITITSTEAQLSIARSFGFEITNIFITNASGSTANIKLMLFE